MAVSSFIFAASSVLAEEKNVNVYSIPRAVPESEIYNRVGKPYKLSGFKGKFVLAVFWSRTCGPCIRELDDLNEFHNKTKDNGIKLVLISPAGEWGSKDEEKAFLEKRGAPDVDFYNDKRGALASDLGIFSFPHTVMVNKHGEEIGRIKGAAEWGNDEIVEYIYGIKAKADKYKPKKIMNIDKIKTGELEEI